ncbi:hypothetical protein HDV05_005156 [Chytridiales sp. JEL 0842]|nr:hypothetical protein HDV05_005156 [Chytridiales sp. JEL 0842]
MNSILLDPFTADFPESIEFRLNHDSISHCRFNFQGNLIAAGCMDGPLLIWDMDTRGIACELRGHVGAITNISWARNGRFLLTSSKDWNCILWDLKEIGKRHVFRLSSTVQMATIHPDESDTIVVCLQSGLPLLLRYNPGTFTGVASEDCWVLGAADAPSEPTSSLEAELVARKLWDGIPITAASFDSTGKRLFLGNSKGLLTIIDYASRKVLQSIKLPGAPGIKGISFSKKGSDVALNCTDKTIRVCAYNHKNEDEVEIEFFKHRFFDAVDQSKWTTCCFSVDSEYLAAGSAAKHVHKIYIWEKGSGALVKMLEGPKEGLTDLAWHPTRPIMASVTGFGAINVWTVKVQENWSAFAPDFKELDENIEYEECEDEFDNVSKDEKRSARLDDDSILIDITSVDNLPTDDQISGFYIPLKLEFDEPQERPSR